MTPSEQKKKIAELKKQLSGCLEEKQKYLEGWQRERADFANYKKAEAERVEESSRRASKDVFFDLLDVLDGLERLEKEIEAEYGRDAFCEGAAKTRKSFLAVINKWGVERIESVGTEFNPEKHEALESIPRGDLPEGEIIEEISAGYLFHGEVLRPARVKVAGPQKENN